MRLTSRDRFWVFSSSMVRGWRSHDRRLWPMGLQDRKPKRVLTAEQKYDLWVRMLSGQITQAQAAVEAGVDRSVISRLRAVARDGAVAALGSSRPGRPGRSSAEASEAAVLRAEVERLQRTVVEQAVELAVLRGKTGWG